MPGRETLSLRVGGESWHSSMPRTSRPVKWVGRQRRAIDQVVARYRRSSEWRLKLLPGQYTTRLGHRADGMALAFEDDMPLTSDKCGGPVVDLAGEVVGITLYSGQCGCMAIPLDCVKKLVPVLKVGNLSNKWIKPPPAWPANQKQGVRHQGSHRPVSLPPG